MAEAIISRRGWTADGKPELRTEVITGNVNWSVPNSIKNTTISVRIFGGGSLSRYGGGSGWMNNGEITVTPGQVIPITIGDGGKYSGGSSYNISGGTTTFGTYLSANGGSGNSGGAGGGVYTDFPSPGVGGQFGGSAGANGGIWGGGGGAVRSINPGDGGMYGGGGGGYSNTNYYFHGVSNGGNGGEYGGGGGAGVHLNIYCRNGRVSDYDTGRGGSGGTYGGNGANYSREAENGTNTIGNESVPKELQGAGIGGNKYELNLVNGSRYVNTVYVNCGGGGGFGGNGGCNTTANKINLGTNTTSTAEVSVIISGGGGGGYGGNGGKPAIRRMFTFNEDTNRCGGGGGGGYGGNGCNGFTNGLGGGGGGYFSDAIDSAGGGYYNYCHGGSRLVSNNANYGYGTGGWFNLASAVYNAKDGACILQYWI